MGTRQAVSSEEEANEASANARDVANMKKLIAEDKKPAPAEEEADELPVERDEDDEPEDDEPEPRAARRANRGRAREQQRIAAEQEAKELRERLARAEGALGVIQQERQRPQGQAEDPFESRIKKARVAQRQLYDQLGAMPETEQRKHLETYQARYDELEDEIAGVRMERIQSRQPRPQSPAEVIIDSEGSDVKDHPNGLQWINIKFQELQARGRQPSAQMLKDAIKAARNELGIGNGRREAPTESLRSRLSGVSRSSSGASGGGPRTVTMTKELKAIARAEFKGVPAEQAYKKWALAHGKEMLEDD